ncbi:hypothetical protein HJC23_010549 [Cyclotella cryptica]|uniref:Plastid lipid-associated protein/fibrillin conserved domain-containing protein n=1 Tax=Cyclotella cryptica TaxID=29204 RepID=A0ABD3QAN5_9STRA|eukprot:CCRYP_007151-RA/>CCRYP_007151-RA protein AED:0.07 eAED:0.07 QI:108/1/1/1/0/0.5/4/670/253
MYRCTSALQTMLHVLLILMSYILSCNAFLDSSQLVPPLATDQYRWTRRYAIKITGNGPKADFLESLDHPYNLNTHNPTRSNLLQKLVEYGSTPGGSNLSKPGKTFPSVAEGSWKVVYAPHMTTFANLLKGEFEVQYNLKNGGTMSSHARYRFPVFSLWGYLSVSGTYGTVNDHVCRVDFNEAWVRSFDNDSFVSGPYPDIDSVPASLWKELIRKIGNAMFIEPFAVFPIAYLDSELIIFDFELFGTRICARKE